MWEPIQILATLSCGSFARDVFLFLFVFSRQAFSAHLWLYRKCLLARPALTSHRSICLSHLNAAIKGVCHHAWPMDFSWLNHLKWTDPTKTQSFELWECTSNLGHTFWGQPRKRMCKKNRGRRWCNFTSTNNILERKDENEASRCKAMHSTWLGYCGFYLVMVSHIFKPSASLAEVGRPLWV